jgi:hypothetical protein
MNSRLASKWFDDFNTLVESLMLSSNVNHSIPIKCGWFRRDLTKTGELTNVCVVSWKAQLGSFKLHSNKGIWNYQTIFFLANFPNFLSNWIVLKIWCSILDNNACYLCLGKVGVVKGPIHVFHTITTKFDKQYVIDVVRGVRMEDTRPHFLKALKFLRKIL